MKRFFVMAGIVLAAMLSTPTLAADKGGPDQYPPWSESDTKALWTSFYFGVGAGGQWALSDLSAELDGVGTLGSINSLGHSGFLYDARAGFDWRFSGTPIVLGAFAGYSGGDTDFNVNIGGTEVLNASLTPTWNVGARVGLVMANNNLLYAGYKYQMAEFNVGFPTAPALCSTTPGLTCSQDLAGHGIIAGVEFKLAPQLTLGVEYSYTEFETANVFTSGPPPAFNVNVDTDYHAVMGRLNWRPFN
jgi:opacity protein-like surface antigen